MSFQYVTRVDNNISTNDKNTTNHWWSSKHWIWLITNDFVQMSSESKCIYNKRFFTFFWRLRRLWRLFIFYFWFFFFIIWFLFFLFFLFFFLFLFFFVRVTLERYVMSLEHFTFFLFCFGNLSWSIITESRKYLNVTSLGTDTVVVFPGLVDGVGSLSDLCSSSVLEWLLKEVRNSLSDPLRV